MHLLPIKHKTTSRKKWGISWNLFRYQKYIIATRCVTESCAKATSLCLQIVELFDVTSKYNIFFLHTNFYFPGLMCSIIILLDESRLANYIFKYRRNTTRAKLRLSYAIEFIIIHNLSYFFACLFLAAVVVHFILRFHFSNYIYFPLHRLCLLP